MPQKHVAQHERTAHPITCQYCGAACRQGVDPGRGYNYGQHLRVLHGVEPTADDLDPITIEGRAQLRTWTYDDCVAIRVAAEELMRQRDAVFAVNMQNPILWEG